MPHCSAAMRAELFKYRKRKKRSLAERILGQETPRLPLANGERMRLQYIIP